MEPTSRNAEKLLTQLLGILRAIHWAHWTGHWQVKGTPAYGDHLLFERLYTAIPEEIDTLAEKVVAFYGTESVSANANMHVAHTFIEAYSEDRIPDVYKRALMMELHLQNALKRVYETLKESNEMSLGLDDFLMAVANTHETHIYLLRQRLRPEAV